MTAGLRRSEQARNAFLTDVTHELRTPLTVIKGTIETLEDGALDDTDGRGPLLASMDRETDRLIRMVNDLLVLTRADAGALQLKPEPLDLAELARRRCEALSPLAKERGVDLLVEAGSRVEVRGDADRLAQVLDNLLDNALRYTAPGTTVRVAIQSEADELTCRVTDAGPGIPAASLPFIFERFYRADASRNRQSGGAGLGLAIVRALVTAHGGRVEAESVEGRGTTISFRLPLD
jgi:signal transduction histidine kinase